MRDWHKKDQVQQKLGTPARNYGNSNRTTGIAEFGQSRTNKLWWQVHLQASSGEVGSCTSPVAYSVSVCIQ
ncbi:hypothetical protein CRENBAI_006346 [Crenichthys baileyi]|uniref:Uncharacterized protein n=1 Tax=Crenichthys baileyi TaxID=28760 RepID=A0AAV9SFC5_9TELE